MAVQFVKGLIYVGSGYHDLDSSGYMLGHKIHGWVPGYFPLAWGVKYPIPLQILALISFGMFLAGVLRRNVCAAEVLIWSAALLLFGLAMLSHLNIGFRHVMPSLPLFIIGGGFVIDRCLKFPVPRIIVALGVAWLCVSSVHTYPFGLSYFNEWIGGPNNGWRYLADSNIDWGQNYPEMATYLNRHNIKDAKVFLFGFDNPWHYMQEGALSPQPYPPATPPGQRYPISPGTYAISVNLLTGLVFPPGQEDYLSEFRDISPTTRAGYSILIYTIK